MVRSRTSDLTGPAAALAGRDGERPQASVDVLPQGHVLGRIVDSAPSVMRWHGRTVLGACEAVDRRDAARDGTGRPAQHLPWWPPDRRRSPHRASPAQTLVGRRATRDGPIWTRAICSGAPSLGTSSARCSRCSRSPGATPSMAGRSPGGSSTHSPDGVSPLPFPALTAQGRAVLELLAAGCAPH
jgi:hypothetical protein